VVIYYHTKSYIYAVTNGYCSNVFLPDGTTAVATQLVGHPLIGGVRIPDFRSDVTIAEMTDGVSLRFDMGSAVLCTEPILFIEHAPTLSIPPRAHSLPPPSIPPPSSEVLKVPRLPGIPDSIRGPSSRK